MTIPMRSRRSSSDAGRREARTLFRRGAQDAREDFADLDTRPDGYALLSEAMSAAPHADDPWGIGYHRTMQRLMRLRYPTTRTGRVTSPAWEGRSEIPRDSLNTPKPRRRFAEAAGSGTHQNPNVARDCGPAKSRLAPEVASRAKGAPDVPDPAGPSLTGLIPDKSPPTAGTA